MTIPQKLAIQIETEENKVVRLYPGGPLQDFYGEELTQIQIAKLAVALLRMCSLNDALLFPIGGIRNPISDIPEQRSGVVYFMRLSNGLINIGFTTQPSQRYKRLDEKYKETLTLLYEIESDDPYALEQQIHQAFESYRVIGEWFSLPDNFIQRLNNNAWVSIP